MTSAQQVRAEPRTTPVLLTDRVRRSRQELSSGFISLLLVLVLGVVLVVAAVRADQRFVRRWRCQLRGTVRNRDGDRRQSLGRLGRRLWSGGGPSSSCARQRPRPARRRCRAVGRGRPTAGARRIRSPCRATKGVRIVHRSCGLGRSGALRCSCWRCRSRGASPTRRRRSDGGVLRRRFGLRRPHRHDRRSGDRRVGGRPWLRVRAGTSVARGVRPADTGSLRLVGLRVRSCRHRGSAGHGRDRIRW